MTFRLKCKDRRVYKPTNKDVELWKTKHVDSYLYTLLQCNPIGTIKIPIKYKDFIYVVKAYRTNYIRVFAKLLKGLLDKPDEKREEIVNKCDHLFKLFDEYFRIIPKPITLSPKFLLDQIYDSNYMNLTPFDLNELKIHIVGPSIIDRLRGTNPAEDVQGIVFKKDILDNPYLQECFIKCGVRPTLNRVGLVSTGYVGENRSEAYCIALQCLLKPLDIETKQIDDDNFRFIQEDIEWQIDQKNFMIHNLTKNYKIKLTIYPRENDYKTVLRYKQLNIYNLDVVIAEAYPRGILPIECIGCHEANYIISHRFNDICEGICYIKPHYYFEKMKLMEKNINKYVFKLDRRVYE